VDLNEVLGNPLFVPLLVAIITIVANAFFLFLLRKWQYRSQYIIENVEKTYVPLLAEINEKLEYFNRFLETPYKVDWTRFEILEKVRKQGLFEFIGSHDRKLYGKLYLLYREICPKFCELDKLYFETLKAVQIEWRSYIENVITDEKAKAGANYFVSELFGRDMFILLLNNRTEEVSSLWTDELYIVGQSNNLYIPISSPEKGTWYFPKENTLLSMFLKMT